MTTTNKMHPDLEWLATAVSDWPKGKHSCNVVHDSTVLPDTKFVNYFDASRTGRYTRALWQAARKELGLDQPEVTEAEEEAWQTKERQLIGGPRKAEAFLNQAAELLAERGKQYDQPGGERSMGKTMSAFNIITGRDLTEAEGWLIMTLLKRVRQHSGAGYHKDSAEDAVAYAGLEAEALESNNR